MGSNRLKNKAHINQIKQIHRRDSGPDKPVEYIIISGYRLHHPAPIRSSSLDLRIIVLCPAAFTTEFLIRASILNLMPTLQTLRDVPDYFRIFHTPQFYQANLTRSFFPDKGHTQYFLYFEIDFSLFYNYPDHKINLCITRFILAFQKRLKRNKKKKNISPVGLKSEVSEKLLTYFASTCKARIRCGEEHIIN